MKRVAFSIPIRALLLLAASLTSFAAESLPEADLWRRDKRVIDLHQHIECTVPRLQRSQAINDAAGIGLGVNLSGGVVTRKNQAVSDFERNKTLVDALHPGRYLQYMNLDYTGWDIPDFSEKAAAQIDEGYRLGAAGLKEYKRLGLYLRDGNGKLIQIDDPKLDRVWQRCGELGMPVSIHIADPKAFWLPYNDQSERWKELKDHRAWWFGDKSIYPTHEELRQALDRVISRHPKTTFVCVHFANNAEDLDWVERSLDAHPNMMADLAARIPEIGRHDPEKVRRLFLKHQDRIFFATDFQVYERLTLGSGGSGPPPTDADAAVFFAKHWRWLETHDRNFAHMTPIQGDWTISGIGLPATVLRKIYFDNATKLLRRSLPLPVMRAARVESDFELNGTLSQPAWERAKAVPLEYESKEYAARPELTTRVRALWSEGYLYLSYESPFTELSTFEKPYPKERIGLWDKDVVEAFIGTDASNIRRYTEFELAPNGEKLDLFLGVNEKSFEWESGFTTAVSIDARKKVWHGQMRIPLKALSPIRPKPGDRWRINLYRCDKKNNAYLAWSPTLKATFHTPERFGVLEFAPNP